MTRRALVALSLLSASVLAPLAACSADESKGKPPTQSSEPTTGPLIEPQAADSAEPSVEQPPELDETEALAAEQAKTRGNRNVQFGAGKKRQVLILAVRCQGDGTVNVTVRPVSVTFPLECLDGEVSTTYNQVGVPGVEKKGTVSIAAPPTVQWSMTVGRGDAISGEETGAGEIQ